MFFDFSQYLRYCMQRRWKNTKAVIFISKKLRFLSQTDLFSLFLYLSFLCFFVSHNTKAYIFFSQPFFSQPLFLHFLCFFGLWLNFFIFVSFLKRVHSFLYPFFLGFYDFLQDKSFNFFWVFSLYFVFWVLTLQKV